MPHSSHAILFVRPFDADTKAVNLGTGGHGFGHVALWGGDVQGDQPIVLDASMTERCVAFRPLHQMTRGVPYVALYLDDRLGERIFARALECIDAPYNFGGLFRHAPRDDAFTCSGLVCRALPAHLAERCRAQAGLFPVSPNAIARAMKVPKWSPKP